MAPPNKEHRNIFDRLANNRPQDWSQDWSCSANEGPAFIIDKEDTDRSIMAHMCAECPQLKTSKKHCDWFRHLAENHNMGFVFWCPVQECQRAILHARFKESKFPEHLKSFPGAADHPWRGKGVSDLQKEGVEPQWRNPLSDPTMAEWQDEVRTISPQQAAAIQKASAAVMGGLALDVGEQAPGGGDPRTTATGGATSAQLAPGLSRVTTFQVSKVPGGKGPQAEEVGDESAPTASGSDKGSPAPSTTAGHVRGKGPLLDPRERETFATGNGQPYTVAIDPAVMLEAAHPARAGQWVYLAGHFNINVGGVVANIISPIYCMTPREGERPLNVLNIETQRPVARKGLSLQVRLTSGIFRETYR